MDAKTILSLLNSCFQYGKDDVDEDEAVFEDPKIKREIEELRKFKDESGIGKVIYNELEVAKKAPLKLLDPWKASRVPNAKYEPKYQTRYLSPMFASPSRIIDRSRRSWDDSDIRGYRTISIVGNFPAPKPGYGLSPRAATLPVSGMYGGPLDLDYRVYDLTLAEGRDHRVSMSSLNTETSKVTSTIFDQPGVSLDDISKELLAHRVKTTGPLLREDFATFTDVSRLFTRAVPRRFKDEDDDYILDDDVVVDADGEEDNDDGNDQDDGEGNDGNAFKR
ncbi:hypothetical protein DPMN_164937 [Dreissena polymorpha]|uniref:Uncharacterized protein n=1 Tax=Dreissena polymorpha TaxID=45954 RepID=A0A9D4EZE7_DREPO|nr:hypothetical protein DPMN_164937 [Dreissena polymorpha]